MNKYKIKKTSTTRALNLLRVFFTFPILENILITLISNNRYKFIQKIIPPDYLYKKGSLRYITRKGINYKLDISNVVDHYLYFQIDDFEYDSILDELKKARVILDIGANIGTTSLFFASINPNAQIISFEPHPHTIKRAEENIKLNNFQNIDLINIGREKITVGR